MTIRFDTYHNAEEHLCRVLDVEVNSPAELAGLQSGGKDYLLGTVSRLLPVEALTHAGSKSVQ